LIMKAGGGIGYNFGHLREEGAIVKSTGQQSGGPLSFMKSFDAMCDTVKQGGSRRGAMMGVLPIWHPDIEKFISMKADGKSFSNFNISVGITDNFMRAVRENAMWELIGHDNSRYGVDARDLWNKIVEQAWKTGDPGLIFLDTINKSHPLEEDIESTNPCGEIPLRPYESCNLGSINLMAYLTNHLTPNLDGLTDSSAVFDWDKLAEDIPTMVRFLDDIIDVNPFPLPEIEKATKESRKIGLGIMGWADCLIKMKIPYDSQEALELAGLLMRFLKEQAEEASQKLGEEKGLFPLDNSEVTGMFRRNATLLCVAPTGTLSRIAGVSSGIEPVFAWETYHKLEGHEYCEKHWAEEDWENTNLTLRPSYMKTANEIPFMWHLAMQAAFQKNVDNSISKTINLASSATVDDVYDIYLEAWKLGLKGITIYRDGSKDNQPLNKVVNPIDYVDEQAAKAILKDSNGYRKRGAVAVGPTHKVDTTKGKAYITVNYSEYHQEPVEVFIRLGHLATPQEQSYADYIGRLISVMLKYNIPVDRIQKQGNKVYSDCVFWYNRRSFQSIPMLISYLLGFTFEEAMEMAEMDIDSMMDNEDSFIEEDGFCAMDRLNEPEFCRKCGEYAVIHEGGCTVCTNCYDEKCGG
jgi:ribonucleoside-diphosphate reductase alpha chain